MMKRGLPDNRTWVALLAAVYLACAMATTMAQDGHEGHDHGEMAETVAVHDGEKDDHEAEETHGAEDHDEGPHEEHDHEEEQAEDDHAGHDHGEDDHGEEGLRLTPEQHKRFGIVLRTAGPGGLQNEIRLPGQIAFNDDRLVHLVPRAPGIAVAVHKGLGDSVKAGETLAVIDSADLASAKLDYLSAVTEVGCCQFELPRAQAIHDNTVKMLDLLQSTPSEDELPQFQVGEMGEYGSRLIIAHAEHVLTQKAYEREKGLLAKKVSSESDFLEAESAFLKAQAEYMATRDLVAYGVRQKLLEARRDRQLAEFEAAAAEQNLHILGLQEDEIADFKAHTIAAGTDNPQKEHVCADPNCKGCASDAHGSGPAALPEFMHENGKLGWYEIKAPFDGVVVQKHITHGERVGEDTDIFAIADASSVWVNLTVHAKQIRLVRPGQSVLLRAEHDGEQARGIVAMVTPFVDEGTRSATARIVLDNQDGRWLPGTFVTGLLSTSADRLPVVVPRAAVQSIEGEDVVFVEHEGAFEIVPVTTGRSDREQVEIVAGLDPGTSYVVAGAFELKATVITSNLDPHAGHGH